MAVIEWFSRQQYFGYSFGLSRFLPNKNEYYSKRLLKDLNKYYEKQGSLVDSITFQGSESSRINCIYTIKSIK